jgi:hypothetical protein
LTASGLVATSFVATVTMAVMAVIVATVNDRAGMAHQDRGMTVRPTQQAKASVTRAGPVTR